MHGDAQFVGLGEFASGSFSGQNPAGFLAYRARYLTAVFFDQLAGFVAVHVGEGARDDGGLTLEQGLDDALEFGGAAEGYELVDFIGVALGVEKS